MIGEQAPELGRSGQHDKTNKLSKFELSNKMNGSLGFQVFKQPSMKWNFFPRLGKVLFPALEEFIYLFAPRAVNNMSDRHVVMVALWGVGEVTPQMDMVEIDVSWPERDPTIQCQFWR
ncbi:hypothetical protein Q669_26495 [Labrenzia sp. C1B10]|nr:hypothetical protein Q669_26495 [Labrenzia sp. C1B10]ERS04422.1 hypothetical protein Q675_29835 [Labrenzia sp. C1B70]